MVSLRRPLGVINPHQARLPHLQARVLLARVLWCTALLTSAATMDIGRAGYAGLCASWVKSEILREVPGLMSQAREFSLKG